MTTVVYTDGACSGNPGPGGWAWINPDGPFAAGPSPDTTNQRMEIMAAFQAVQAIPGPLEIISDSTYVVNCFNKKWWEGWLKRGWLNSQKKPVANRDLWEPFIELVRDRDDVTFTWVKGHSGNEWNEHADQLAVEAGVHQADRSGESTPDSYNIPTKTSSASNGASDGAVRPPRERLPLGAPPTYSAGIGGHTMVILGHRPPELGGYDDNPIAAGVRGQLVEIIAAKSAMHDDLVVVSGLRLGAEMLGAEAAVEVGVPLVAVLPYPNPESVWPAPARARFTALLEAAAASLTLEKKVPDSKQKAGAALSRRDGWLAGHVDEAVLVWNGDDPALKKLHKTLDAKLDADLWVLNP